MKTFKDYEYIRPNTDEIKNKIEAIISDFNKAASAEEQINLMMKFNDVQRNIETMYNLASIRHDVNTKDEFYENEKAFWDEYSPELAGFKSKYAKSVLSSKFRGEIEKKFGSHLFTTIELEKKVFDESIAEDMALENKLVSEYHKLVAIGKVKVQGKEMTLNEVTPLREDKDRELRKEANEAYFGYFADNVDEFDRIYDELVKLRTKMAKKLGYENFVQMAYDRMGRSDYSPKEVAEYRKQILDNLVPLSNELRKSQKERLGIDKLYYYDDGFKFNSGNPTPKGTPDEIMENGKKMYGELSEKLKEFFDFMQSHELFDVLNRPAKKAGGYCTFIPDYESPFIFANFNGTDHDINVLTHEAGHAFQIYNSSKEQPLLEYLWPTMDAAEIHSMSMEFITWPWMELFFKEDTEKYKYSHITGAIKFIPYGATIDEFQHVVYENPEMTPLERRNAFREIEKKYLPHIDYAGNEFLESGGFFFRQLHVFAMPFYYIDYTLAQVCALQFWKKSREDREKTLEIYTEFCKAGGSKPFLELLKIGELNNPFVDGTIKKTVEPVIEYLNGVDDKNM